MSSDDAKMARGDGFTDISAEVKKITENGQNTPEPNNQIQIRKHKKHDKMNSKEKRECEGIIQIYTRTTCTITPNLIVSFVINKIYFCNSNSGRTTHKNLLSYY